MRFGNKKRLKLAAMLLAAAWLLAPSSRSSREARQPEAPGASAGMRASIDPVTGQLIEPEWSELATPAPLPAGRFSAAPASEPALLEGPEGAVGLALDESTMVFSVATIGRDGTISFSEAQGPEEAERLVRDPKRREKVSER